MKQKQIRITNLRKTLDDKGGNRIFFMNAGKFAMLLNCGNIEFEAKKSKRVGEKEGIDE